MRKRTFIDSHGLHWFRFDNDEGRQVAAVDISEVSIPDPPLEHWLLGIATRCAIYRARRNGLPFASAFEAVFDMLQANLPNILVSVPRAAPGTNHLIVRFGIRWAGYRQIARAADDRLVRILH